MPTASAQTRTSTPAAPPAGGGDLNIPPPNAPETPPATTPDGAAVTTQAPPVLPTDLAPVGLTSTGLVIALVLIVAWAGLLLLVRRLLTQSLLAQFADLGRSRSAGTTLYVFLLVLGATVIVCALGGFWKALEIMVPVGVLNLVLLVLFLVTLNGARASRQRR